MFKSLTTNIVGLSINLNVHVFLSDEALFTCFPHDDNSSYIAIL